MNLSDIKKDCAVKQKKGLHFILASIIIWIAVLFVQISSLPILTKNLFTFCCTAPLLPIAYLISKIIKVDFQNKENPLTNLGVLFSVNQILYLLIAMWIYPTIPEKCWWSSLWFLERIYCHIVGYIVLKVICFFQFWFLCWH